MVREAEAELGPLEIREIDISEEPEAVREYGLLTTPALVSNGRLEFSGVPKTKKLIKRLREIRQQTS